MVALLKKKIERVKNIKSKILKKEDLDYDLIFGSDLELDPAEEEVFEEELHFCV